MKKDGIIVYPTETLYGIGGDALKSEVIQKIYRIKKRDSLKPIPVLIRDLKMLDLLVEEIPESAKKLIKEFWPGPLTIIFRASRLVPDILTANTGKIGIRVSNNRLVKEIFKRFDSPLTSTSANISGKEILTSPDKIIKQLGKEVDLIIDYGEVEDRSPSTVIDIISHRIIREGKIPKEEILSVLREEIW